MRTILLFYLTLFVTNFSAQFLTTSMTACYDLNGTGTEALNNLTGTVTVATPTVDRFNNAASAMYFNGTTSSMIKLLDNPLIKPANALSFSLWLRAESNSGRHIIYTKNNQSVNFEAYQLCIFSGSPVFRLNKANASQNNIALSTTTVSIGTWYHIVCTIDNSMLKLYVNGVLEGSAPSTFNGYDYMAGKSVFVGNSNESFNLPFLGSIDNLKFWNRVITQSEVTQLYNNDPSCTMMAVPISSFVASSYTACAGTVVSFTDLSKNNPTIWNWQVSGAASFSTGVSSPTMNFATPGVYNVSLTVANNIGSHVSVQSLTVFPAPMVGISPTSLSVCAGNSVTLSASGATSYTWSTTHTTQAIQVSPQATTIYTVQGTNGGGCLGESSVTVSVVQGLVLAAVSSTDEVCQGSSVSLAAAGASSYSWSSGQTTSSIQIVPLVSSVYTVTGTSSLGCSANATLGVNVKASPIVKVTSPNLTVCSGDKVVLNASGAQTYSWNTLQGGAAITATLSATTLFSVVGTSTLGCSSSATISIKAIICTGLSFNEPGSEAFLACYPNPVKDLLYVESNTALRVNLYDSMGRTLLSGVEVAGGRTALDISDLASGIYFLTDASRSSFKPVKVIKQ